MVHLGVELIGYKCFNKRPIPLGKFSIKNADTENDIFNEIQ